MTFTRFISNPCLLYYLRDRLSAILVWLLTNLHWQGISLITHSFLTFYFAVAPSKLEQPSYQSEAKGYQPEPQQTLAPEPVASYNTIPQQQGYYLVCFSVNIGFIFVLLDVTAMKMYFVF